MPILRNTTPSELGFLHWWGHLAIQVARVGASLVFDSEDLSVAVVAMSFSEPQQLGLDLFEALTDEQRRMSAQLGFAPTANCLAPSIQFQFN